MRSGSIIERWVLEQLGGIASATASTACSDVSTTDRHRPLRRSWLLIASSISPLAIFMRKVAASR